MWIYCSETGDLFHDDKYEGRGYSGFGKGKDNPSWDHVHAIGPIPRGDWAISKPEHHHGLAAPVLRLTPIHGTDTFGRSGFLIHGDKIIAPGAASHGCIILARGIREAIAASGDRVLKIIPEPL